MKDHDPRKFDTRMFMTQEKRAQVIEEREAVEYVLYERVNVLAHGIGTIVQVLDDGTFKVELLNGSIQYKDKQSLRKTAQLQVGSLIELDSEHQIGSTFERHGHIYRVTECRYISPSEVADLEDQDLFVHAGWHTTAMLEK